MGNRKKEIWRELKKEDEVVRLVGEQYNRIWKYGVGRSGRK